METPAHQRLKIMAAQFLRRQGCVAHALEVTCPISRFRVDAAGWCDSPPLDGRGVPVPVSPRERAEPITIVIECKQCRADFLRDNEEAERLQEHREHLRAMKRSIEEHGIKSREPQLRRSGTSLFAELDEWDFGSSQSRNYRRVLRELDRVEIKLHGETKFHLMARYRLADRLYLAAPRGVIRSTEVPRGWGLLECHSQCVEEESEGGEMSDPLVVTVEAPHLDARSNRRLRLLRNIAVAARSMRLFGAETAPGPVRMPAD